MKLEQRKLNESTLHANVCGVLIDFLNVNDHCASNRFSSGDLLSSNILFTGGVSNNGRLVGGVVTLLAQELEPDVEYKGGGGTGVALV